MQQRVKFKSNYAVEAIEELPQITECMISPEILKKLREGNMSKVWIPVTAAEMIWHDALNEVDEVEDGEDR